MPTVFEGLSDEFYKAFFESNPEIRRAAINLWIKNATPVIQSEIENELRNFIDQVLKQTWTEEGWQNRVKKFAGSTADVRKKSQTPIPFIDGYQLRLTLDFGRPWNVYKYDNLRSVYQVTSDMRLDTLQVASTAVKQIEQQEAEIVAKQRAEREAANKASNNNHSLQNSDDDGDDSDDDRADGRDDGRSSNDDRSDSMNPNNDAYWSSRG